MLPRQTPEEYAREVFETLTAIGSDYASAMREARIALADARADDTTARVLGLKPDALGCPDTFPAEWDA